MTQLRLRSAESISAYCWRAEEVEARCEYYAGRLELAWLRSAFIALACTGLRISDLASLWWNAIDFERGTTRLSDETGHAKRPSANRRLESGRSRSLPIPPSLLEELLRSARPMSRLEAWCEPNYRASV